MPSPTENVARAEQEVELALMEVHSANERYIKACSALGKAKLELARSTPHPWLGQQVYRIMGGGNIRTRAEHGIVHFKDFHCPDYGNPHIKPGSYYVLVDGKSAHALTKEWELDLL
jgi:hypothetical protein